MKYFIHFLFWLFPSQFDIFIICWICLIFVIAKSFICTLYWQANITEFFTLWLKKTFSDFPFSQSCCWKCAPCSTNEISHNPVNGSCKRCPPRYWPNANRTACLPIIPTTVKLSDPAGISVGVVAALGGLGVLSITIVFFRHGNTHVVRASSKVLSYIMLFGISLGYLAAVLILLERTKTLCQVVLFLLSIGFCIVVGTLLIKTNRIHRIFSKNAMRKGMLYNFLCSCLFSFGLT